MRLRYQRSRLAMWGPSRWFRCSSGQARRTVGRCKPRGTTNPQAGRTARCLLPAPGGPERYSFDALAGGLLPCRSAGGTLCRRCARCAGSRRRRRRRPPSPARRATRAATAHARPAGGRSVRRPAPPAPRSPARYRPGPTARGRERRAACDETAIGADAPQRGVREGARRCLAAGAGSPIRRPAGVEFVTCACAGSQTVVFLPCSSPLPPGSYPTCSGGNGTRAAPAAPMGRSRAMPGGSTAMARRMRRHRDRRRCLQGPGSGLP